jgi:hypothetical protein
LEIEPTAEFPPETPLTLQVTVALELPVTVAAYWELPPSITVPGPVNAMDTVAASPLPKRAGLLTVSPQAASSSTKHVLRIAKMRGRQARRILLSSGHCGMPKNVRREIGSRRRLVNRAVTEEKSPAIAKKGPLLPGVYCTHSGKVHFFCNDAASTWASHFSAKRIHERHLDKKLPSIV